ncbi:colon cancer-associated protein mic1 [Anaeramoeba flamelloides]|uniref:Colon cancer-associated protein mic1 n=1 Tax=Anaeramoeba flamelloides TaxID=1746091 RepID=A0ABQ8Y2Y4_9EUKA|nr:colon cancer-associated protein mic1 [Anaeramoeba flamelloides]
MDNNLLTSLKFSKIVRFKQNGVRYCSFDKGINELIIVKKNTIYCLNFDKVITKYNIPNPKKVNKILDIKFSFDKKYIAIIHYTEKMFSYHIFDLNGFCATFKIKEKTRKFSVLGVRWINNRELFFISNSYVEHLIKNSRILLLSTKKDGQTLQFLQFRKNQTIKLKSIELDCQPFPKPQITKNVVETKKAKTNQNNFDKVKQNQQNLKALNRSIKIRILNKKIYIIHCLRHKTTPHIYLYELNKLNTIKKELTVEKLGGYFRLSFLDNLILVHLPQANISSLYDIQHLSSKENKKQKTKKKLENEKGHLPIVSFKMINEDSLKFHNKRKEKNKKMNNNELKLRLRRKSNIENKDFKQDINKGNQIELELKEINKSTLNNNSSDDTDNSNNFINDNINNSSNNNNNNNNNNTNNNNNNDKNTNNNNKNTMGNEDGYIMINPFNENKNIDQSDNKDKNNCSLLQSNLISPNIIFSKKNSFIAKISIDWEEVALSIKDINRRFQFLLKRKMGKKIFLKLFKQALIEQPKLSEISRIFYIINSIQSSILNGNHLLSRINQNILLYPDEEFSKGEKKGRIVSPRLGSKKKSISTIKLFKSRSFSTNLEARSQFVKKQNSRNNNKNSKYNTDNGDDGYGHTLNNNNEMKLKNTIITQRSLSQNNFHFLEFNQDGYLIISQSEIIQNVFHPLYDNEEIDQNYLLSVLIEYLRTLCVFHLEINYTIPHLVVDLSYDTKQYSQFHQFIMHLIINDSPQWGHYIARRGSQYSPIFLLALDIFKRIDCKEEIFSWLIDSNKIYLALKVIEKEKIPKEMIIQILEKTFKQKDKCQFINAFEYLEDLIPKDYYQKFKLMYDDIANNPEEY